ncbi:MAG: biotin/lipoyl-binding protein [Alloprevotella sp.]|nr:biotin/lipoyl-binding protein [Alloprevotella sp.]
MSEKNNKLNLLPSIAILLVVTTAAILMGLYAYSEVDDTIQGQVDVDEYRVSSKVPGRVLSIRVREGQTVHAGDTLALLEAPDVQAKLSQAEAARDAAAAMQRKATGSARAEQVRAAYEMWQKAKAALTVMEKSYARTKALYDDHVVTAQRLDEITAQRDAAIATERAAKAQYDMAVNGAEQADREAAAAQVERAKGAVSEVSSYVDETVLLALHDGEVTEIFPQEGELVGTGAPIMNVAVMERMWVAFNVHEDHLASFPMNGRIQAVIPALGNREVELVVYHQRDLGSFAAWKATKTTGQYDMRTFEVKAAPTKPIEGLRPGMSVLFK